MPSNGVTTALIAGATAVGAVGGYLLSRYASSRRRFAPLPENIPQSDNMVPATDATKDALKKWLLTDPQPTPSSTSKRVLIVTIRLPIKTPRKAEGGWDFEWEDARSFTRNLKALEMDGFTVVYVGCPPIDVKRDEREEYEDFLRQHDCIPVFLAPILHKRFNQEFCRNVLWPTLHYVLPRTIENFSKDWDDNWQAYTAANMSFAKAVQMSVESPSDPIWIQNYHFFLVPSFLRMKLPTAKIGFFLHTPFPSSDIFRLLPARENILRGLLCSDLIGFQTYEYQRHFISSCSRVLNINVTKQEDDFSKMGLNYSGRFVRLLISHVGIDSNRWQQLSYHPNVVAKSKQIRAQHSNRKIIIGIDNLDMVKGSLLKFQAFERFLSMHPDWVDKVTLVQVILPSANDHLQNVRSLVMCEIDKIRSLFGNKVIACTEPVREGEFREEDVAALYLAADAALVSTVFDGLNLFPYEFTASQRPDDPAALVISEFMGCSRSLSGAIRVNPWSLENVSDALLEALSLNLEQRKEAHQRRYDYVCAHTMRAWANNFISVLHKSVSSNEGLAFIQVGFGSNVRLVGLRSDFRELDTKDITRKYSQSEERFLLFDYDGTLTKNTQVRGQSSAPSAKLLKYLRTLCADPKNHVFLLSGRKRQLLQEWFFGIDDLGIAAEKGYFLRWPKRLSALCRCDGKTPAYGSDSEPLDQWEQILPEADLNWMPLVRRVLGEYTKQTDGSFIEVKECSLVWHFENADPEYGKMQAQEVTSVLEEVLVGHRTELVTYDYNCILEVKPHGISKGLTAEVIMSTLLRLNGRSEQQKAAAPFLLCIGDDKSDEEMFIVVQDREDKCLASPAYEGSLLTHRAEIIEDRKRRSFDQRKKKRQTMGSSSPNTFTVCVGIKPSNAHYFIQDTTQVVALLKTLSIASGKRRGGSGGSRDLLLDLKAGGTGAI